MQNTHQILLFYKYVYIADPIATRDWFRALGEKYDLKGRFIIATEGINITLEGTVENTEAFIVDMETDPRFHTIHMKRSPGTGTAFPKLSVKARSEIVSAHLGVCDVDPNVMTGKRLSPEELHSWLVPKDGESKKEFYIVDMRNAYEHAVGHFEGSILPAMDNFRDLQKITKDIMHLKDKTVLTVCTGGVRCEKASGYLVSQGFTDVYQLDGGIVSYMEKYPNEDFHGKLYVFDSRVLMTPARPEAEGGGFYSDDPAHIIVGKCASCAAPSENMVDCRSGSCNGQFVICADCEASQIDAKGHTHCPQGCPVVQVRKPSLFAQTVQKIRKVFSL